MFIVQSEIKAKKHNIFGKYEETYISFRENHSEISKSETALDSMYESYVRGKGKWLITLINNLYIS